MSERRTSRTPASGLPTAYGRSRLTVLEVDPFHLFAYWELAPEDVERALQDLPAPAWVLRFHDLGPRTAEPGTVRGLFDVAVVPEEGRRYVELWTDDRCYLAEIGPRGADGRFVPLGRSPVAETPRAGPTLRYAPSWMRVEPGPPKEVLTFQSDWNVGTSPPARLVPHIPGLSSGLLAGGGGC